MAISPLVLQYAQRARTYTLAMLLLTLAALSAIELVRRGSWGWAIGGAMACIVALSLLAWVAVAVGSTPAPAPPARRPRLLRHGGYISVAVPFVLVTVGTVVARTSVPVALGILGILLIAGVVGDLGSHRTQGFYPDTRDVVAAVDRGWRANDVVLDEGTLGVHFPLVYYAQTQLPPNATVLSRSRIRRFGRCSLADLGCG